MPRSAYKNKCVQYVFDSELDYLPFPLDFPTPTGKDKDGKNVVVSVLHHQL